MASPNDLIRSRAEQIGFDVIKFTRAELGPVGQLRLEEFVSEGYHGSMGWLAERIEERSHPRGLWPEARSVICVGLNYAPTGSALENLSSGSIGNISVYARHRDYHNVMKGMLKHLAQFIVSRVGGEVKVFVDTAPVMEKPLAEKAGIGWQGKHTNLVSRRHGSWLFLGEIYSSLDLTTDEAARDSCGKCRRCLDACPTDAFPAPYRLDATRCISYLTIEHQGPIPVNLRPAIGNRIYGCDDCLAVCPWNRFAVASKHLKLKARDDLQAPSLMELADLDDAKFRLRFAGTPVKRIGRDRFARNVAIAIGNSAKSFLLPAAMKLAEDSNSIVADAGRWAVEQLSG